MHFPRCIYLHVKWMERIGRWEAVAVSFTSYTTSAHFFLLFLLLAIHSYIILLRKTTKYCCPGDRALCIVCVCNRRMHMTIYCRFDFFNNFSCFLWRLPLYPSRIALIAVVPLRLKPTTIWSFLRHLQTTMNRRVQKFHWRSPKNDDIRAKSSTAQCSNEPKLTQLHWILSRCEQWTEVHGCR